MATDYSQGDYRVVAKRLLPAAQELVTRCAPGSGDLVVDVAAGTGNVARLCAARGARVIATDLSPAQLRLGRSDDDPHVSWVAADAHALPLRTGTADAALSTFGLVYAEQPGVAVAEVARVCRPGVALGLTAWRADGYQKASAMLLREALSLQVTHDFLVVWGDEDAIRQQLAPVADDVEVDTADLVDRYDSVDAWWQARQASPPMANARSQLDDAAYDELGRRMRELAQEFAEPGEGIVLRDQYLVAVGRVRTRPHTA